MKRRATISLYNCVSTGFGRARTGGGTAIGQGKIVREPGPCPSRAGRSAPSRYLRWLATWFVLVRQNRGSASEDGDGAQRGAGAPESTRTTVPSRYARGCRREEPETWCPACQRMDYRSIWRVMLHC